MLLFEKDEYSCKLTVWNGEDHGENLLVCTEDDPWVARAVAWKNWMTG
jgi:hypothetical protein